MKIHFLGLGGAGLSALAGWMADQGYRVSGCDLEPNVRIKPLIEKGVEFKKGNSPDHITDDLDWLVHPNIDQSHPEIEAAKNKGIKTLTYFDALGEVTKNYFTIAVSGAHGKTTTTSMLKTLFKQADRDVNAIIGEGFYCSGRENVFIVEACEYKKQFLSLNPDVLVITNIAYDHPDFYDSIEDTVSAFKELINQVKRDGMVIGFSQDKRVIELIRFSKDKGLKTKLYGEELIDYQPRGWGSVSKIDFDGKERLLALDLPGKHNVYNALAALEVGISQGVDLDKAIAGLSSFSGCRLRLEKVGEIKDTPLILDYGHHPDQIEAVLSSLKDAYPDKKIAVVFEPHQYERTWQLFERFGTCWPGIEKLYLLPIYKVKGRESKQALAEVSSEKIQKKIVTEGINVELFKNNNRMWEKLNREIDKFDLVVVFAAGPLSNFVRCQFDG
jgi:UDP-N-acetylmuramate--alanine ligase